MRAPFVKPLGPDFDRGVIYRAVDPLFAEIERRRRGHMWFFIIAGPLVSGVAGVAAAAYTLTQVDGFLIAALGGGAMFLTTLYGFYRVLDRDYRMMCKRQFNRRLAEAMGLDYRPRGAGLRLGDFHPDFILPPYARAVPEDALSFPHNGRRITVQEVVFHKTRSAESHLFNPRSFHGKRGLLILVPANRTFEAHTVVVPRRQFRSDRNRARFMGLRNYEYTPFGNLAFRDRYYVMSTAGDYAHFVFDPAFIERVLAFEKICGARSLSFSFRAGHVLIYADHAHDFMEAGGMMRRLTLERADAMIAEMNALTELIDVLALGPYASV